MLEAVERLLQIFIVELEVHEFEFKRVVAGFQLFGIGHHSVIICPRDGRVVAGHEE